MKPWLKNAQAHEKKTIRKNSVIAKKKQRLDKLNQNALDLKYQDYLTVVDSLNKKKEFLKEFRNSLDDGQKRKAIEQIKKLHRHIDILEAQLFVKKTPQQALSPDFINIKK